MQKATQPLTEGEAGFVMQANDSLTASDGTARGEETFTSDPGGMASEVSAAPAYAKTDCAAYSADLSLCSPNEELPGFLLTTTFQPQGEGLVFLEIDPRTGTAGGAEASAIVLRSDILILPRQQRQQGPTSR
jgi:hypothetical protein